MPAHDLLARVEALGAPYGLERSAKFVEGALYDDRCLVSLHARAFGADPASAVREMAAQLGAPVEVREAVAERLRAADVVHFGHEAEGAVVTRKLYFEYVAGARAAMAERRPALVHLAYKWRADGLGATALTRYVWRPCATRAEAEARVAERLPAETAPRARTAALGVVEAASLGARHGPRGPGPALKGAWDSGGPALEMLDVEEPGGPRRSIDINVYDAELTLGDVAPIVAATGAAFGIAAARLAETFGPTIRSTLGHLAAGLDRREREFVTFYFGVEARGG